MSAVNAPLLTLAIPCFRRLDALLLAVLVLARIRIDTLAEAAVLPPRLADVARHPFLGRLLSADAMRLLAQQQLVDPIALLLIVAALGCLLVYLLVDEFVRRAPRRVTGVKLALICLIIALTVFLPSLKLVLLRQQSGPASYSHDGGVIQTEATIDYFLRGRNPYVEDYVKTPMAEWGINEFRTALYHYPYLPWTFLFSAPFRLLSQALLGWYDQRFVYLLLFALTLALLPRPARGRASGRCCCVMLIGLNPIMGSDLIYGQNDSFVLAWIVLSLWLWERGSEAGGRGLADRFGGGIRPGLRQQADGLVPGAVLPAVDRWRCSRPSRSATAAWLAAGRPRLAGPRSSRRVADRRAVLRLEPGCDVRRRLEVVGRHVGDRLPDLGLGRVEPGAGARLGQEPLRLLAVLAAGVARRRAADGGAARPAVAREHAWPRRCGATRSSSSPSSSSRAS